MSTETPLNPVYGCNYDGDASPADREAYIDWAYRAAAAGRVAATSPLRGDLYCVRDVVLDSSGMVADPAEDGVTLMFLEEGEEPSDLNMDFGDKAYRHLMHDDGQGVTLCNPQNVPWVHYRIVEGD